MTRSAAEISAGLEPAHERRRQGVALGGDVCRAVDAFSAPYLDLEEPVLCPVAGRREPVDGSVGDVAAPLAHPLAQVG